MQSIEEPGARGSPGSPPSPHAAPAAPPRISGPRLGPLIGPERSHLAVALLVSCLLHALMLSLAFSGEGFGLPGLHLPWQDRRTVVPDLHVVLSAAPVAPAVPAPETIGPAPVPADSPPQLARAQPPSLQAQAQEVAQEVAQEQAQELALPAPVAPLQLAGTEPVAPVDMPSVAELIERRVVADVPEVVEPTRATTQEAAVRDIDPAVPGEPQRPVSALVAQEPIEEPAWVAPQDLAPQDLAPPAVTAAAPAASSAESLLAAAPAPAGHAQPPIDVPDGERAAAQDLLEQLRVQSQQQAALLEATRRAVLRADALGAEAQRLDAARVEAARVEAARVEAARVEAERVEAERLRTERHTRALQEAERRREAQAETARQEAARAEVMRLEAMRQQAAQEAAARGLAQRLQAEREQAERLAVERQAAEREQAARLEAARIAAARQDAERQEAQRLQAAQEEAAYTARREAVRRAIGRQLDEEADRRNAAAAAQVQRTPSTLPYSWSSARRGRLLGRTDTNAELVLYAEAWARKIQLNTSVDKVRELARRPHANPLVTVALRNDGSVETITFVVSSGVPDIDEAIRQIVLSQVPYPAFPPVLAREFDVVEIRRTWHFDTAVRLD